MSDIRDQLLNAAHELLRERGIMGATTREIARAAGVADGTLYNHFRTREDLFLALFDRIVPAFKQARSELPLLVGQGDVRGNLETVMVPMLEFFRDVVPIFAAVFSDPALNERYRTLLTAEDRGPHRASIPFEKYLQAERRMGRISDQVDPSTTAQQLVAAAFFQAFIERFLAKKPTAAADRRWASAQIKAITAGWSVEARR